MTQSLFRRAVGRVRRDWHRARFEAVARRVHDTPALRMTGETPVFLSQLCERDVTGYLLAIKSLYRRIGAGRVCIVDDGSLTAGSRGLLARHVPALEFVDIGGIDTGPCPRGGTWERLCRIVEMARERYVIQVDADTLTVGDVPEVLDCVRQGRSFLLGTDSGQAVAPAAEAAAMARGWMERYGWTELPLEAEAALDRLPDAQRVCYVHASSGFAGFAPGAVRIEDLHRFSEQMTGLLGRALWEGWGSEQISSNYVLANAPAATVLPFPRYACVEDAGVADASVFLHFLGSHRYESDLYRRFARRSLAVLAGGGGA